VGPSDLAASLGHLGRSAHADVQKVIADVCSRALRAGKPAGILAPIEEDARRFLAMGFSFVAVGSDLSVLRLGAERLRDAFTAEAPRG
jgi:2-dehydro-3-deoxyglucarate aldolase